MVILNKRQMKLSSFLLASILVVPLPGFAQQVNNYGVCTQYQEVYTPDIVCKLHNYSPAVQIQEEAQLE